MNLSAKEAVERLCSGQVTSTEYTQALLQQIELHACLNNFAALDPGKVLHVYTPAHKLLSWHELRTITATQQVKMPSDWLQR